MYENICYKCNPSALNKGELKEQESNNVRLYMGESARSIEERANEQWGAVRRGYGRSHML